MPLFGTIASAKRLYYTHELLHLTPTYWWTLNDSSISNVVISGDTITSIASGGSEPTTVTTAGTGVTSVIDNDNRYFYALDELFHNYVLSKSIEIAYPDGYRHPKELELEANVYSAVPTTIVNVPVV